jgi:hypothetical protein
MYGTTGRKKINEQLPNRTMAAIGLKAQWLGLVGNRRISSRKYTIDNAYFSDMSYQSIYWAGFIAADGCISKDERDIQITLGRKDRDRLETFKNHISYSGHIYDFDNTCSNGTTCHMSTLGLNGCDNMVYDLKTFYGIINNKSLILRPPPVLMTDVQKLIYILGYIDGDGTFSFRKQGKKKDIFLSIRGTLCFLNWIKDLFDKIEPSSKISSVSIADGYGKYSVQGKRAYRLGKVFLSIIDNYKIDRMMRKINKEKITIYEEKHNNNVSVG